MIYSPMSAMPACVTLALVMLLAAPASATTKLNDKFDNENGGVAQLNYAAFRHFNVTSGEVDLIGNGTNDLYPGHGLYVDMCGSGSACGTMTTKAMFPAGKYSILIKLAGNDRDNEPDGVNVTFGAFSKDFMAKAYDKPFKVVETITLTAPAPLSISDLGLINSLHGTILFSVSIAPSK